VRVSPSKVERFNQCGLSWFLGAVGGSGPAMGAQVVGTLVHDIVAEHPDAERAVLDAELDRRWGRLGLPPGWLTDRARQEAHDMLARFVSYRADAAGEGWQPVAIEADFRVAIGRADLKGRVDRIEQDRHGRLRIIDLKTGRSKPTVAEIVEHGQLGAYQAAVESGAFESLGTTSGGAALAQIGKAGRSGLRAAVQEQAPVAEADDPRWAHRLVEETATGMGAATFQAVQGSWCQVCAVKACCPVQPEGDAL
jgi:RecB family exonuclease